MKLKNAKIFFENLQTETNGKSELKLYREFIQIITSLEKKNLAENEIQAIELELDNLNLKSTPENRKKYFTKAMNDFKKYLKDTFSLTTKGYYTTYYGGLGLVFGLLFGVAILSNLERSLGLSIGLTGGMIVGSILGRNKDIQVKAAGKML